MEYDMSCRAVTENLNAYIDGELDLATAKAIERHLTTCNDCRIEYENLIQTASLVRQTALNPPDTLRASVLARVKASKKSLLRRRIAAFSSAAAAIICLFVVAAVLLNSLSGVLSGKPSSPDAESHQASDSYGKDNVSSSEKTNYSLLPFYAEFNVKSETSFASLKILDRSEAVCRISDYVQNTDTVYVGNCTVNPDNSLTLTLSPETNPSESYTATFSYNSKTDKLSLISGGFPANPFVTY